MLRYKYVFHQLDETTSWIAWTSEGLIRWYSRNDHSKRSLRTIPKPDNNDENNYNQIARRLDTSMLSEAFSQQLKALMILWLADNSMVQQYKQTIQWCNDTSRRFDGATIWADDSMARRYDQRSLHRLNNLMIQWKLQWQDVRESYDTDRKINSERYPLQIR